MSNFAFTVPENIVAIEINMKNISKLISAVQKGYKLQIPTIKTDRAYSAHTYHPDVQKMLLGQKKYKEEDWITPFDKALITYKTPTQKHIREDLEACINHYSMVRWEEYNGQIICRTPKIFISNVLLGEYDIAFNYYFGYRHALSPSIEIQPITSRRFGSVCHPNVSYNILCAGDGIDALSMAIIECRIFDYFNIIERILSSPSSEPFLSLRAWRQVKKCADCDAIVPRRVRCSNCNTLFCPNCIAAKKEKLCFSCS